MLISLFPTSAHPTSRHQYSDVYITHLLSFTYSFYIIWILNWLPTFIMITYWSFIWPAVARVFHNKLSYLAIVTPLRQSLRQLQQSNVSRRSIFCLSIVIIVRVGLFALFFFNGLHTLFWFPADSAEIRAILSGVGPETRILPGWPFFLGCRKQRDGAHPA